MDICSDRRFRFEVDRSEAWTAMTSVDRYQDWWPWLSEFDGSAFVEGATWSCVVKPPLPYMLAFDVTLLEVVDRETVCARIDGDITGTARLTATDHGDGCELRLVSDLRAESGTLRLVTRFARPVAMFGHNWVLDTGVRRFRSIALGA